MSPAGERGLTPVEIEAIVERLRSIDETLTRIEDKRLASIELHLQTLNGRMGKVEQWQAATDPMMDSMNERIDEVTDMSDKSKDWISEQRGWNSARTQMIVQISMLVGVIATLIKIIFFHS